MHFRSTVGKIRGPLLPAGELARAQARTALSLIETLVVLAILAALVAMLLPAVQQARQASQRTHCSENLKQLGLGLHNYHSAHLIFPPSITFDTGTDCPDGPNVYRPNWVVAILPFVEEQDLYNQFDLTRPLNAEVNRAARSTELPLMLCPADDGNETKFGKYPGHIQGTDWARGNYGANACLGSCYWFEDASSPAAMAAKAGGGPDQPYWHGSKLWDARYSRGVMGANTSLRLDKITDGATKTILLAELRVGLSKFDRRGTWAMGAPGASSLWGHAHSPDSGPNSSTADCIGSCDEIVESVGAEVVEHERMQCGPLGDPSTNRATAHSRHTGGVMACMVDGSVHFVSEAIESGWLDPARFRVWQRLNASADGLFVDLSKLDD